jgi:hypothetical protein
VHVRFLHFCPTSIQLTKFDARPLYGISRASGASLTVRLFIGDFKSATTLLQKVQQPSIEKKNGERGI